MRQWLFPVAIGLFLGILAMWILRNDPAAPTDGVLGPAAVEIPGEPDVAAAPTLAALREAIAQEIEAREWLSEEVDWLRAEVSRLVEAGRRYEPDPADPDVRADLGTEPVPGEEHG